MHIVLHDHIVAFLKTDLLINKLNNLVKNLRDISDKIDDISDEIDDWATWTNWVSWVTWTSWPLGPVGLLGPFKSVGSYLDTNSENKIASKNDKQLIHH